MEWEERLPLSWFLKGALFLSFGILFCGTVRLALVRGRYYRLLARENRIQQRLIPAARGEIRDRKGRVLAESVYDYFTANEEGKRVYEVSDEFRGYRFEGKDMSFELKRKYGYGEVTGLLTGYVGKASQEEMEEGECGVDLTGMDVVGQGGVEEAMDCYLRGENGKRLLEVDAKGNYIRELGRQEPKPGQDLTLSIDAFWQEKIYEKLTNKKAVVIMSQPKTGKILVVASSPSFDPNLFSYQKNDYLVEAYLADKDNLPLLNRATAAVYQPGSVFKMVVATAGLQEGVIDAKTTFEDTGVISLGEWEFSNWLWNKRGATDGLVDVVKGIRRSNDIFFYRLGEKLGVDGIKVWAFRFGFGDKSGVELPGELLGVVPDDEWKRRNKGERWFLGNTYHLAIGQGDLAVTPIQVNQMTNVVANKGLACKMSVLKDSKVSCEDLKLSEETVSLVTEGMRQACQPGGTAWPLFNFKTELACKTGTAEVGEESEGTHAWLTAFGPVADPEISITVLVEKGGEGSDVAAPIVGDVLKEWFEEPETKVPRYGEDGQVVYE